MADVNLIFGNNSEQFAHSREGYPFESVCQENCYINKLVV